MCVALHLSVTLYTLYNTSIHLPLLFSVLVLSSRSLSLSLNLSQPLSTSLNLYLSLCVSHPLSRGPGDVIGDCKVQFLDEIYQVEKPGARALSAADGQFKRMRRTSHNHTHIVILVAKLVYVIFEGIFQNCRTIKSSTFCTQCMCACVYEGFLIVLVL